MNLEELKNGWRHCSACVLQESKSADLLAAFQSTLKSPRPCSFTYRWVCMHAFMLAAVASGKWKERQLRSISEDCLTHTNKTRWLWSFCCAESTVSFTVHSWSIKQKEICSRWSCLSGIAQCTNQRCPIIVHSGPKNKTSQSDVASKLDPCSHEQIEGPVKLKGNWHSLQPLWPSLWKGGPGCSVVVWVTYSETIITMVRLGLFSTIWLPCDFICRQGESTMVFLLSEIQVTNCHWTSVSDTHSPQLIFCLLPGIYHFWSVTSEFCQFARVLQNGVLRTVWHCQ